MNLEQFPIQNFNENRQNFDKVIEDLIQFEKKQKIKIGIEHGTDEKSLGDVQNEVDALVNDLDSFETLLGLKKYNISL